MNGNCMPETAGICGHRYSTKLHGRVLKLVTLSR